MKRKIFTVIGLVAAALGVYLFAVSGESNEPKESETQNIKELVHDYSVGNIKNESASITSQQLIVTDSGESQLTYDLPEDEFFVSIAPYVEKTHPCAVHSLTGCRGEMVGEEFSVYIEDTEGNLILDQTLKSQSNGFIDLWVPRDKAYRVTIAHDGKTVESEFSTFESDNTCITTMQLTENKNA
ncbi:CueP family metal-binding protein [Bacillus sp. V3B]|uniref:CueP family metal-binding protein n=1 Tax=Bacillus sp. V3B TaxID=2804915 RepID=UPI00210CE4E7|nr:CueP family metal-binding protein [Bacillus sp. V3B]MCQ6276297.1 CueP family metal-binding protein [Bacillus sp. V3B]